MSGGAGPPTVEQPVRPRGAHVWREPRPVVGFGLLLVLAALSAAAYLGTSQRAYGLGFPLDDSWIHQTYARNLAERGEWAFLPGQPSAGSTGPLWTAALALGRWLGLDYRLWTYGLGVLLLATAGWLCWRWLASRQPTRRGVALAGGLLVVLEWHLIWAGLSGMETLALALVVVLVLWGLDADRPGPLGIGLLIGLGIWLRPDALTLLLPAGLTAVLVKKPRPWPLVRRLVMITLGTALLLLPYLFFNHALSGEWWPSTFYAKQAEYAVMRQAPLLQRIADQLVAPLIGAGAVLAIGIVLGAWRQARSRAWARLAPLAWAGAYLTMYALRLPVTHQYGRYAMPVIPVLLVLGMEGLLGWAQPGSVHALRRIASRTWILTLAAATILYWFQGARLYARDVAIIETEMVAAARWISTQTPPESLVAAHDIGALGYFGEREILDLAGLVSPEVIPILRDEAALTDLLDRRHADYLMTFPGWYPALTLRAEPVYTTGGQFAPAAGHENMVVYRWRAGPFARAASGVLYFPQSCGGRVDHGNDRGHHR